MGFDLNALAGKKTVVTVEFMGQTASVFYDPSLLTQGNVTKSQQGDAQFVEFFTTLVKDWDVKKGAKKVPLTAKGLEDIPLSFLRAIYRKIATDTGGSEEEGNSSSAG